MKKSTSKPKAVDSPKVSKTEKKHPDSMKTKKDKEIKPSRDMPHW